jgi:hypothetical protein
MSKVNINTNTGGRALNTQMQDQLRGLGVALPTLPDPVDMGVPPMETPQSGVPMLPQRQQQDVQDYMVPPAGQQEQQPMDEQFSQSPPTPLDVGNEQWDMPDLKGNIIDRGVAAKMHQEEKARQAAYATGIRANYENAQQLESMLPKSINSSNSGKILEASRGLGDALNNTRYTIQSDETGAMPVQDTSALTQVGQSLQRSPVEVANLASMSLSMAMPVVSGATKKDGATAIDSNKEVDEMLSWGNDIPGVETAPVQSLSMHGGVPTDTLAAILGNNAMKIHQMGNVDAQGNALPPKPVGIKTKELGTTLMQAAIDAGYLFTTKVDGVEIARINPISGMEFYKASRAMSREIVDAGRGRPQTVPASSSGSYIGGAATIRSGNKMGKVNASVPKEITELLRIEGSIPFTVSPVKTYLEALFVNQAVTAMFPSAGMDTLEAAKNHPRGKVGQPIKGLTSTLKLMGVSESDMATPKVLKQKATVLTKLVGYHAELVGAGTPVYNTRWTDPTVYRTYVDNEYLNVQRDMNSRAVAGAVVVPRYVNKTALHTGVTPAQSQRIYDGIANKAMNKDTTLTPEQQEYSWLALFGKTMEVGDKIGRDTDSLLIPDLVTLVTPAVLAEAAEVGRVLRSIMPSSKSQIVAAADMRALFDQSIQLNPEQLAVLNNLISSSTKKNWGYKVQAYLDAANYLDAKVNGTAFSPRLTNEIDMSSAGRTFAAMDTGNLDVLSRTGILYAESVDPMTDTVPEGNPRFFFYQNMIDQGIDKAFTTDKKELADAWRTLLTQFKSPEIAEDVKHVLMTTDYGMPASYHQSRARKFIEKNPELAEKLMPLYDGNKGDIVNDLNNLFKVTLLATTNELQTQLPKDMVATLAMVGRLPMPKGIFGETMSVGGFIYKGDGTYTVLRSGDGSERVIEGTRRVASPAAAAKPKMIEKENHDGSISHELFTPGPGTAAKNQIGPVLGQYRESALMQRIQEHFNGGKKPNEMSFITGVHDNVILNADSFVQVHAVANNLLLPDVLDFSLPEALAADLYKQVPEAMAEIGKEKTIYLNKDSKYYGALVTMDTAYSYNKSRIEDGLFVQPHMKEYIKWLESPASGYIPPSADRPETFEMTPAQLVMNIKQYMNHHLFSWQGEARVNNKVKMWTELGAVKRRQIMPRIKEQARRKRINFMV